MSYRSPITALDVLTHGRTLIEPIKNWAQGHMALAETPKGLKFDTQPEFSNARCYCALGAARRAGHNLGLNSGEIHLPTHPVAQATQLLNDAARRLGFSDIIFLNDRDKIRTLNPPAEQIHAEVLRAYDLAIEVAQALLAPPPPPSLPPALTSAA